MTRRRWSPSENTARGGRRGQRAGGCGGALRGACLAESGRDEGEGLTLCPDSEPSQVTLYASGDMAAGTGARQAAASPVSVRIVRDEQEDATAEFD